MTTFLPNPDEAADELGRLGITHDKTVVAYSDGGNLYASRLWHVLAHYGHDRVALLDGGIEKWEAEGQPARARHRVVPCRRRSSPESRPGMRGIGAEEIRPAAR